MGSESRGGGGRAARYKRIAQAYYRSQLAAREATQEEGKPARRFDPVRNRAYRQAAATHQAAMRAQKPHPQPDSDDIAARFERDDRTTTALLDELRDRRIRAGLDEMEAEKKLTYRDARPAPCIPPDVGWKKDDHDQLEHARDLATQAGGIGTTFTPHPTTPPTVTPTGTSKPSFAKPPVTMTPSPPIPIPTPIPTVTPLPATAQTPSRPWWVPLFSEQEARQLVQNIPSVGIGSSRTPVPVAKVFALDKMFSFGTVTAWNFASNANPGAELRTHGFGAGTVSGPDKLSGSTKVNLDTGEISSSIRLPTGFRFTQDGFSSSLGYSISARAQWGGWNTTASIDLNYADVKASNAGTKGNISGGVYLEVRLLQTTAIILLITAVVATPFDELVAMSKGGWIILQEIGRRLLPRLLPGFGG